MRIRDKSVAAYARIGRAMIVAAMMIAAGAVRACALRDLREANAEVTAASDKRGGPDEEDDERWRAAVQHRSAVCASLAADQWPASLGGVSAGRRKSSRRDGEDPLRWQVRGLGGIVGADGWILTKATPLCDEVKCVLADGRELAGEMVSINHSTMSPW